MSNYVFNQFGVIKNDVALAKLSQAEKLQAAANMVAAGLMTNIATNAVSGRDLVDFGDIIPFLRPIQIGFGGPAVAIQRAVKSGAKGNVLSAATELSGLIPGALKIDAPLALKTVRNISNIPSSASPIEAVRQAMFGRPTKR
jgi:hypothetical protein